MKAVVQVVNFSEVKVDGQSVGKCREGLFVLLGVTETDWTAWNAAAAHSPVLVSCLW